MLGVALYPIICCDKRALMCRRKRYVRELRKLGEDVSEI